MKITADRRKLAVKRVSESLRAYRATAYPLQRQLVTAIEAGEAPQFGQEAAVEALPFPRLIVQLQVQKLQSATGAIGLSVESANQAITKQQRQAEVAEFPVFFANIAFDLVVKIKQFQGAPTLNDCIIKRRQDSEIRPEARVDPPTPADLVGSSRDCHSP